MRKGKGAKTVSNMKPYIFIIWDDVAIGRIMIKIGRSIKKGEYSTN